MITENRVATEDPRLVLIAQPRLKGLKARLEHLGWRMGELWALTEEDQLNAIALINVGETQLPNELLGSLPKLGLIANVGAGYDGVDVAWCRGKDIAVTHARHLNAADVADHAMGLLIASWRNIAEGDRLIRADDWGDHAHIKAAPSLAHRRLGVVGLGGIGAAVARRAEAFGLTVAWWGPNPKAAPWPRAESLLKLADESDVLVVACRADASNCGIISADIIAAVGGGGLIVNVARGSLIDEAALIAALREKRLGRAALDVFVEEPARAARWANVPNLVLTPHLAGATEDSIPILLDQAVENVRRFLAGEALLSPI